MMSLLKGKHSCKVSVLEDRNPDNSMPRIPCPHEGSTAYRLRFRQADLLIPYGFRKPIPVPEGHLCSRDRIGGRNSYEKGLHHLSCSSASFRLEKAKEAIRNDAANNVGRVSLMLCMRLDSLQKTLWIAISTGKRRTANQKNISTCAESPACFGEFHYQCFLYGCLLPQ